MSPDFIRPEWPAPINVRALTTTRTGGYSKGMWSSLNLGLRCGDEISAVMCNRKILEQYLPGPPQWLEQVHGNGVVEHPSEVDGEKEGDALVARSTGQVCAVLTADCLPVFFCNDRGNRVAVAHAGWRGLAGGILQATVAAMDEDAGRIMAWLGPAIGPGVYEVGREVRQAFGDEVSGCFAQHRDRWLLDLYSAARFKLNQIGIDRIYGGGFCTFSDSSQFYSYRRDGETGRMASLIWMNPVL